MEGSGTPHAKTCGETATHLVKAPQQWPTHVYQVCVSEWYHTRSPGENILGLKKGHDTLYTAFGEKIS